MFTRSQVDAIAAGRTKLARSFTGVQFGAFDMVTQIHAKADDINGKLFVCGYTQFGEGAELSFSIKEGEALDFRLYRIDNGTGE